MDARDTLDQQIAQLQQQIAQGADTTLTFTGTGPDNINNISLSSGAWAYLITLPEPSTGTTTICADGKNFNDRHFTAYANYAHATYYRKDTTIQYITMDYPSAWQLTIVKLPEVTSASYEATGSGASCFFLPATAQAVAHHHHSQLRRLLLPEHIGGQ